MDQAVSENGSAKHLHAVDVLAEVAQMAIDYA